MNKISCYINMYYDLDFIDDIIDGISEYIDEIILVDGPFNYCINFLKKMNLYYDEFSKPIELNNFIEKYKNKIKYFYRHWENENEKRIFGYSMCSNDYILLVDSDEFYYINGKNLENFILSEKRVAYMDIYNMCRIDVFQEKSKKYVFFKKDDISPRDHLAYLWLVGCNDIPEKNIDYMDIHNSIGTIYHQTINRSKKYSVIKYIF
jgi:hypothetical protein